MKVKPSKKCPKCNCFLMPRKKYRKVGNREIFTGFTMYICINCDQRLR